MPICGEQRQKWFTPANRFDHQCFIDVRWWNTQHTGDDFRIPFGHTHGSQEEVYVLLSGSARIKLDDEVHELRPLDAVRAGYDEVTHINFIMMQAMPQEVVDKANTAARLEGPAKYGKDVDLDSPAMKAVAALRNQFGGHAVQAVQQQEAEKPA